MKKREKEWDEGKKEKENNKNICYPPSVVPYCAISISYHAVYSSSVIFSSAISCVTWENGIGIPPTRREKIIINHMALSKLINNKVIVNTWYHRFVVPSDKRLLGSHQFSTTFHICKGSVCERRRASHSTRNLTTLREDRSTRIWSQQFGSFLTFVF